MEMTFNIHNPHIILKDRPYLETHLEVDLGELTISFAERNIKGRFKKEPEKTLI
jgi:hypothetical protein